MLIASRVVQGLGGAMLGDDVQELQQLERLAHHLKAFSDVVWTWRCE